MSAVDTLVGRMTAVFGPPRHLKGESAVNSALAEYRRAIEVFRPTIDEVENGWPRVLETHKSTSWPAIAVILEPMRAFRARVTAAARAPKSETAQFQPRETAEDRRKFDDMVNKLRKAVAGDEGDLRLALFESMKARGVRGLDDAKLWDVAKPDPGFAQRMLQMAEAKLAYDERLPAEEEQPHTEGFL